MKKRIDIDQAEFDEGVQFTLFEILDNRPDLDEYFAKKDNEEADGSR